MKKLYIVLLALLPLSGWAQSKTTNTLQEKYKDSFALYFYKNTLRMLNQKDDKEIDELIKNIERLKFLILDKTKTKFGAEQYKKLLGDYKKESYEPVLTGRYKGRNMDIYMRDKSGPLATIMLLNDSTDLYVVDMIGTIDMTKANSLFSLIDNNADITKRIEDYTDRAEKKSKKDKKKKDEDEDDK